MIRNAEVRRLMMLARIAALHARVDAASARWGGDVRAECRAIEGRAAVRHWVKLARESLRAPLK
jgi:hypothetical protein